MKTITKISENKFEKWAHKINEYLGGLHKNKIYLNLYLNWLFYRTLSIQNIPTTLNSVCCYTLGGKPPCRKRKYSKSNSQPI